MADEEASAEDGRVERLISWAASVVAPLSVLTAVLFYFGYASSRAHFEYFGVDVDTIGLSTQDYVMRSPQALLTPLLVLVLVGVAVAIGDDVFRRRVHAAAVASTDADDSVAGQGRGRLAELERSFRLLELAGRCLLAVGALLLFGYAVLQDWTPYPLVTPLVMGIGAGLALSSARIRGLIRAEAGARVGVVLALSLVLVTDVFWATATAAQWSGRGSARQLALHLDQLPTVIVDTRERLNSVSPTIKESALPASAAQTFHYRYRGLHLLIQGRDRLFLVPGVWSPSNFTLMLPMDGSVRLQFQFENLRP
jgi:hypothetical protein